MASMGFQTISPQIFALLLRTCLIRNYSLTLRIPLLNFSNSLSKCVRLSPKRFFILVFSTFIFLEVMLSSLLRFIECSIRWMNLRDQSWFGSSSNADAFLPQHPFHQFLRLVLFSALAYL